MNDVQFRIAVFLSGAAGLLRQTLRVRRLGFIFGNRTTSVVSSSPVSSLFGRAEVDAYVEHVLPVTDDRPSLEFNILSRWRDARFTTLREENLSRMSALRRPIGVYLTPSDQPQK